MDLLVAKAFTANSQSVQNINWLAAHGQLGSRLIRLVYIREAHDLTSDLKANILLRFATIWDLQGKCWMKKGFKSSAPEHSRWFFPSKSSWWSCIIF